VYTATTGTRTIIDITNSASGTLTSDIHDPVNIITSDIITEIVITDTAENILLIIYQAPLNLIQVVLHNGYNIRCRQHFLQA
jgi:hypothetical protein